MRVRTLACLLVAFALREPVSAQTMEPRFSLAINSTTTTVKAGSDLRIQILQKNVTGQDQQFWIDKHYRDNGEYLYSIDVLRISGGKAPKSQYFRDLIDEAGNFRSGVATSGMLITKRPGESISSSIDLNKLYELVPGRYTVQVSQKDGIGKRTVSSNIVSLTVVP